MNETTLKDRIRIIEAMHTIITSMNDERAYVSWINTVPDEATYDDFEEIAQDTELYDEVCAKFTRLVKGYGKSGFYASGDDNAHGQYETYEVNGEKRTERFVPRDYIGEHKLVCHVNEDVDLVENWYGLEFFTNRIQKGL